MKNNLKGRLNRWWLLMPVLVSVALSVTSCREDYILDEQEPDWLGESIYDFLVEEGKYSNFVRLIEELGYKDVLQRTGSKTLFVVDDATFEAFLRDNEWGISSYAELSKMQKEQLLYSSMLDNVYFSEMLGDAPGPQKGMTIRRNSSLRVAHKLDKVAKSDFPNSFYWNLVKNNMTGDSIILLQDNTPAPMVTFAYSYMINNSLVGSDYAFVTNQPFGYVYDNTHVFVNGTRIVEANKKCKNGVVHRLERMVTPLTNMAETICLNDSTLVFASLLDRFSAPYPSKSGTQEYGNGTDVYIKKYFTERGHSEGIDGYPAASNVSFMTTPTDSAVGVGLKFDPGWNTLTASDIKPMNEDMSAMFVPTDEALGKFLHEGAGKFLYDRYGSWEGIPNHVIADLLNNHMKSSFVGAVPSKFDQVKNDAQIDMGVKAENVVKSVLCCNGVVYVTDSVYAPVSYVAVTAPTLVNDNMNVIRWSTEEYGFLAYLHSMDSYYSFLLPVDEAFARYLDPVSVAKGEPEYWNFVYDNDHKSIEVIVTDTLGNKKEGLRAWASSEHARIIQNRLEDLIDQHIIVDDIEAVADGKYYYQTKGKGTVKVTPSVATDGLDIYGGYQLEAGLPVSVPRSMVNPAGNGKSYVISNLTQASMKSVYSAMGEQAVDEDSPFFQFYQLMQESGVFIVDDSYAMSSDRTVDVFNTFHYTIYVPSNEAILEAINQGLPTMEQAEAYLEGKDFSSAQESEYLDSIREILHDFVCYHIHDNSVYVGGGKVNNQEFQTGTMNKEAGVFRRLRVNADNSSLIVWDGANRSHSVNVDPKVEGVSYNLMTRDYLFNDGDAQGKVDASDLKISNSKCIETSSFAVIHTINDVLYYDDAQLESYKARVEHLQNRFNNLK